MLRSLALSVAVWLALPLSSACTAGSSPAPAGSPNQATGPLPAGTYDVSERVLFDTCRPSRTVPPRVTLLKRHDGAAPRASVPVQRFGEFQKPKSRVELDLRGYQASGMSHPKHCPGQQHVYRESLETLSDTSFRVHVEFEVADGWDCPNPRPAPLCKTSVVYEYRLASAACDARCDGFVPGVSDQDVPDGPVALTCACR